MIFGSDAKYGINEFIGLLGCKTLRRESNNFESNYNVVANEVINNENVEIKGI